MFSLSTITWFMHLFYVGGDKILWFLKETYACGHDKLLNSQVKKFPNDSLSQEHADMLKAIIT